MGDAAADEYATSRIKSSLAEALGEAGLQEEAMRVARGIKNSPLRGRTRAFLASLIAEDGDLPGAVFQARSIVDPASRARALLTIALEQPRVGNWHGFFQVLDAMPEKATRVRALTVNAWNVGTRG